MLRLVSGQGFTAQPARKPAALCRQLGVMAVALLLGHLMSLAGALAAAPADPVNRMLALVNGARAETGLTPLSLEPRLTAAACRQAQDLSRGGELTHQGRDGSDLGRRVAESGYTLALAAENLAAGAPSPDETLRLWLASPGHRRNILTAEFRHAGIAYRAPGAVWVMVFGALRGPQGGLTIPVLPQPTVVNGC